MFHPCHPKYYVIDIYDGEIYSLTQRYILPHYQKCHMAKFHSMAPMGFDKGHVDKDFKQRYIQPSGNKRCRIDIWLELVLKHVLLKMWTIVDHGSLLIPDNGLTKHENENWISKCIF
jgi:hypothetical protein